MLRLWGLSGGVGVVLHTKVGLKSSSPLPQRTAPHPLWAPLTSPPGPPNTKIDSVHPLSIYIKDRHITIHKGYDSKQQNQKKTQTQLGSTAILPMGGAASSLPFLMGRGIMLLEVACPQILKSALPGGGPKRSKLLYYYCCLNTISI